MEFIAMYWLFWLISFLSSLSCLIFLQMRAIKTMEIPSPFIFAILAFFANGSMALLIISIVINIFKYVKIEMMV